MGIEDFNKMLQELVTAEEVRFRRWQEEFDRRHEELMKMIDSTERREARNHDVRRRK